jgi:hypothetical protein
MLAVNAYKSPTNPGLTFKGRREIADRKNLIDQQRENSNFLAIESQE